MSSEILTSFGGALQASLSVLLVIFYGVLASQFDLIDNTSAKKFSHVSVKMFLPMLLVTNVGRELSSSNGAKYIPILIWSILTNLISMGVGLAAVKLLKMPRWVTPAITFNNTTSLPLLLVQSMESTGILNAILSDGESTKDAINRAQSYFLVCAVVSNCLTFALGPVLLDGGEALEREITEPQNGHATRADGSGIGATDSTEDETTSLLPDRIATLESQTHALIHDNAHNLLHKIHLHPDDLSTRTNFWLRITGSLFNAPLIGALLGFLLGLVAPLHKAFFADSTHGGIFTAWLTQSLRNTGELFVSLQVIIVGVKLSSSLRKLKRGDTQAAGHMPWHAALFVFAVRYVFWPLVSVPVIYVLAKGWLGGVGGVGEDKVLWFAMMLMPCGPSAMSLIPMADVSGKDEDVKMTVAKLLTGMYAVSPVLAGVVVVALRLCQRL